MKNQAETNFEVNLLPVISLLAVCISFLLVTAVWLPLGTLDVKQAIGENSESSGKSPSRIEIEMPENNLYYISLEVDGKKTSEIKVSDDSKDHKKLSESILNIKHSHPEVNMAFIAPSRQIQYQKVISLLEVLNKMELKEVGIIPSL